MELLTGKEKESFLEWLDKQDLAPYRVIFDEVPLIIQTSYIIEWLDSVGIKILPCYGLSGWYCVVKNYNNKEFGNYKCFHVVNNRINDFDTRQEAITEAIKKANEIYNKIQP